MDVSTNNQGTIVFDNTDIFQFNTLDNLHHYLVNSTIGLNTLNNFNDIYESAFILKLIRDLSKGYSSDLSFEEWIEYSKYHDSISAKIDRDINDFHISCFSRNIHEPLMWSHYADSYRGFAVCFGKIDLEEEGFHFGGDVIYSNKIPEIKIKQGCTTREEYFEELKNIIFTKQLNWTYEKEFRKVYYKPKNPYLKFKPQCLKAIVLGFRNKEFDQTLSLVDDYNKKHNTNVVVLKSVPLDRNYEFKN